MTWLTITGIVLKVLLAAPSLIADVMTFIQKIKELIHGQGVRLSLADRADLANQAKAAVDEAIITKDASKLEDHYKRLSTLCQNGMC